MVDTIDVNGMYCKYIMGGKNQLKTLQDYFALNMEKEELERRFKVVLRKQGWFCNRCGKRREMMYEGKIIRFEEDHKCNPKDVLTRKFKKMERGW